jgi:heat shock protein HslJ
MSRVVATTAILGRSPMRAALLALPVLAACATEPMMTASAPAGPALADTTWMLESVGADAPPSAVSLNFTADRVSGEAPCNRYMGGYVQTGAALEIGPVAATRRACPHLAAEDRFFGALTDVASAEVAGEVLILRNAEGAELMRFRRA